MDRQTPVTVADIVQEETDQEFFSDVNADIIKWCHVSGVSICDCSLGPA